MDVWPRKPSDVPPLIDILTDVYNLTKYPVDGPASFPERFKSPNALISFVASLDGDIAGHAELQDASTLNPVVVESIIVHAPINSFAALVSLFVDPRFQGKGVGSRLIREAVAWGRKKGKRLVLIVLEKDTAAIHTYEKMGWKRGVKYFYETKDGEKYLAFSYVAPP